MWFNHDNMAIFWYMFSQFQSKLLTLISALNPFLQSKWLLAIVIKFIMIHKELSKIAIMKAPIFWIVTVLNSFPEFCCSIILESSSDAVCSYQIHSNNFFSSGQLERHSLRSPKYIQPNNSAKCIWKIK